ncbi:microtubule-associated protein 9 [Myripristis murdjan]|uniref:microtubule-associated protein 9 n=1 Tax=Myripristis murdjan TaxID=586833 RepID=UPI001175E757|nr:microtubule-associated protein 9 [Myripristis murdjan]
MAHQEFSTLAHKKSPKASKRTTFQDELEATVSARASRTKAGRHTNSGDFNEDDDDFFKELLKSRKKKTDAFKTGRTKIKINDFEISDDEGKNDRKKKVSFLKTKRVSSPSRDVMASDSHGNEQPDSSTTLSYYQHSTSVNEEDDKSEQSGEDSTHPESARKSPSEDPSHQTSEGSQLDTSQSVSGVMETPDPFVSENGSVAEREPPKPKPRLRTAGLNFHVMEEQDEDAGSQDVSRPSSSSVSLPFSHDTTDRITVSPHRPGRVSPSLARRGHSLSLTKSTVDTGSRDFLNSDDSKEHEGKYSTSFEEFHGDSGDRSTRSTGHKKSFDTRTSSSSAKSSQRSQSACSLKVKSKYMGTLKVLDRKVSLEDSQPQGSDSLRAAIYQEWLKKKKEQLREKMQQKKQEEILREEREKEKQTKKEEAIVSYEVWKEKKAEVLRAKAREKQDMLRKQQRATEEKEEKSESAKKVFEKWKQEHDELLKVKNRKQREAENKLKLEKQEMEEERKRNSKYAFLSWDEKKKNVLDEKAMMERKKNEDKAEEERYRKEERDTEAVEMYEKWLMRKELEQRRQREERRIQAILQNSPPPPWSPPNKTVPFRR